MRITKLLDEERFVEDGCNSYWTLDPPEGVEYKCDRCGEVHKKTDQFFEFKLFILYDLFKGRNKKPDIPDFCDSCLKHALPLFYALRDIDELMIFNFRLKRAIDEKRKQ